ncbi:hypothetical protein ACPOL_4913 [Acidisarcina polymorpha]|uniref:Uncharacterized protein n=1 Tax=Acidisarcina polymorpha TaxID=2211140 RepID=A0A2Z5G6C3_9BACT|nr:hypothetical protein ACPOL_4913 [Acidisarcina polymorpha]
MTGELRIDIFKKFRETALAGYFRARAFVCVRRKPQSDLYLFEAVALPF